MKPGCDLWSWVVEAAFDVLLVFWEDRVVSEEIEGEAGEISKQGEEKSMVRRGEVAAEPAQDRGDHRDMIVVMILLKKLVVEVSPAFAGCGVSQGEVGFGETS